MLDALVSDKMGFKQRYHGKKESSKKILITGTTKALLFNTINREIRNRYTDNMPLMYATPIVYMDEYEAQNLQNELKKV